MPAPSPHVGPCKRCGGTLDVCGLGRYRGLCEVCRPLVATEQAQARLARTQGRDDGIDDDTRNRAKQPPLTRVVQELVPLAKNLEKAIDGKKAAHHSAMAALSEFREGLQLVSRVAQPRGWQDGRLTSSRVDRRSFLVRALGLALAPTALGRVQATAKAATEMTAVRWLTPRTWQTGDILTASMLNSQIRDQGPWLFAPEDQMLIKLEYAS